MPFFIFFLILFGVPYLELSLFIEVGGEIGVLNTIFLCLLTAFIGIALIHKQGIETFTQAQEKMRQNIMPEEEIMHGFALLIAGIALLIPGFFTDSIGFLLLIPPFRRAIFDRYRENGSHFFVFSNKPSSSKPQENSGKTIEGEYRSLDKDDK